MTVKPSCAGREAVVFTVAVSVVDVTTSPSVSISGRTCKAVLNCLHSCRDGTYGEQGERFSQILRHIADNGPEFITCHSLRSRHQGCSHTVQLGSGAQTNANNGC